MKATVRRKIRCIDGLKYIVYEDGVIINFATGKEIKQRLNTNGYLTAMLGKSIKHRSRLVHRIVAEAFIPNLHRYPIVHHKDGNRANTHASNLEWTTQCENIRRAYERGSYDRKGTKNGRAILTENDVLTIRKRYKRGKIRADLARLYGLAWTTIHKVVNNISWTHV